MERCRKGFTLIELLVVIAIIAILAAILFPLFTNAKKSAQRSACLSNFKQMGVAVGMYLSESSGRYPCEPQDVRPAVIPASDWDSYGTLPGASRLATACVWTFRQYVKSPRIWTCPSGAIRSRGSSIYTDPSGRRVGQGCALVGWIKCPGVGWVSCNYAAYAFTRHAYPVSATQVHLSTAADPGDGLCAQGKDPVQFYNECSTGSVSGPTHYRFQAWVFNDAYDPSEPPLRFYAHRGGSGGLFYDGHVQWRKDTRFDAGNLR